MQLKVLNAWPVSQTARFGTNRERRATERRIRQAKFPVVKTMDSFDSLAIPSLFTTTAALVSELIEARDDKKLLRFEKQIVSYELLIVDELGFVPLSKTGAEPRSDRNVLLAVSLSAR